MSDFLKGRTALVTGASSGLGVEFARELALRGCHLVLVARREAALRELETELHTDVSVQVRPCDLSDAAARETLVRDLHSEGVQIDVLVNNAGLGVFGPFLDADWPRLRGMLDVDVVALSHLTHLLTPFMCERGWGRVLQVASTAAFQPTPGYAAYAAAKSYVLSFSYALDHELRGSGVRCTAVCPGMTATGFFEVAGHPPGHFRRLTLMQPQSVAERGIEAMLGGRSGIVTGALNALMAVSTRLLPRRLLAPIAGWAMKN